MRGGIRFRRHEDEEESAFVSMTDMTVSFLFIVMILLAFFASQFQRDDVVPRPEYNDVVEERNNLRKLVQQKRDEIEQLKNEIAELRNQLEKLRPDDPLQTYLAAVAVERARILKTLKDRLKADIPELDVEISREQDALQFKGDGLFASGSSTLDDQKRRIVETIGVRLNELLPCYTLGDLSHRTEDCSAVDAIIEAVQIEGHTDADGDPDSNLSLSTARANETFFAMKRHTPGILEHWNNRRQPVLSVAGYGEMRPVEDNFTTTGKAANRRIELRIIMYTPSSPEEIAEIKEDLRRGMAVETRP